jgi:hypothetical protein
MRKWFLFVFVIKIIINHIFFLFIFLPTRQVGSIENDAIRNIYGTFGNLAYQDSLTATGGKSVAQGAFARVIRDVNTIETYGTSFCPAQVEYYPNDRDGIVFDAGTVVPTGPENTVINTGRTPVIYLGV